MVLTAYTGPGRRGRYRDADIGIAVIELSRVPRRGVLPAAYSE